MSLQPTEVAPVEQVEYRDVAGFPGYRVGSDGSVWSRKNKRSHQLGEWKTMKGSPSRKGYIVVSLGNPAPRVRKHVFVHKLVLIAFVGPRSKGLQCRHLDGVKTNNRADNLCWGTAKENADDVVRHGTRCQGERHPLAKLTGEQVIEIRTRMLAGEFQRDLAAEFGVTEASMYAIAAGKTWNHVGTPMNGVGKKGDRNGRHKLHESDVIAIKIRLASGEGGSAIARDYGISKDAISNIKTGKTWRHLP